MQSSRHSVAYARPAFPAAASPDGLVADLEIVHVVRQYAPRIGGLEEFVAKLAAEQRTAYRRVRVITCDRVFTDPQTRLAARETIDGIEVQRLPYVGSNRYPIMRGLVGAIATADIVHVHAIDYAFDMLAMTRPIHRKTLVVTTHGGFFHTSAYAALKAGWFRTMTRLSASRYDAVVCCSEPDLERFRQIVGPRAQLVMNGVDIHKFARAGAPRLGRNLLALGRFSTNKRLDRLIDVMAQLVRQDPAWSLSICGVPSGVSVGDLERLIAERQLQANVSIHVGLSDAGLREEMGRASFFVSASEYEGFGLALVEALSAGLLSVVHENSAFAAIAASRPGVVTSDFADAEATANRIRELHETAGRDLEGLRRAMEDSVGEFSWNRISRQYDRIYAEARSGR